mmetsp:Transcript_98142/g.262079  ORF Transcript_98142/g.262079 Transcript_98142/m.262079 type:complete len:202 (+) Transcript_98142:3-608(+)
MANRQMTRVCGSVRLIDWAWDLWSARSFALLSFCGVCSWRGVLLSSVMRVGAIVLGVVAGSLLMDRARAGERTTLLSDALLEKSTTTTSSTTTTTTTIATIPAWCRHARKTYRNHPQCRGSRLLQKAEAVGVVEQCALWKAVVNGSLPLESFLSMAGEETKVGWTTFGEAMRELEALPEEERRVEEGRLVEMGRGLASELC